MKVDDIKFCPQCGTSDLATREVVPNLVVEMYCPHCGVISLLLLCEQELVGHTATHDPDSDFESW
jgi:ribosomal protein S27AE